MTDAALLLLAHVDDLREVGDLLDLREPRQIALLSQRHLQLE